MIDFRSLKKIELHLHLDGSVRYQTLKELLNKNIDENDVIAKEKCEDLSDYLTKFDLPIEVMQTRENLERIAYELTEDLVSDNVIYAEIRFAPLKHTKYLSEEEVVDAVLKGLKRNKLIKTNLILCMMRDANFTENKKVIDLARKFLKKGVCAIDLAGAENLYKTSSFENLFTLAKEKNIPFTIHAGEADGIESINSAINFGTKRIGHGIRIIDDDKTIEILKKKSILLEICPTSNYQTNVIGRYENHPILNLYKKGINISINTDNRTVSNITLTEEYKLLNKYFKLNIPDFNRINYNSIDYTFLSNGEKEELKQLFTL